MLKKDRVLKSCDMARMRLSITLEKEMLTWLDEQVRTQIYLRDRSHAIEIALTEFRRRIENRELLVENPPWAIPKKDRVQPLEKVPE